MTLFCRYQRSLIALLAFMLLCLAPGLRTQAAEAKPAGSEPGPYGITVKTLKNGMDLVVIENHGLPLVTIEIAAKNGAYTEPPEYNGLSHLYEHMFFKANATIPNQMKYMERLRELGASWNGTTSDERVNYFMTVHNKNLREGAMFLRDALRYPLFKEEELRGEWPVVLGEFDRNEATPEFHLSREIDRLMWHKYFSRKNTIGDRDVIFNATREQMRTIQHRYYVPNNCALFVGGDVRPSDVFELAEELFGDWERGDDPHKKWPEPEHPPLEKTSRIVVTGPVRTATIEVAWHGPSIGKDTAATYAADVLGTILGQPDSKFQKALVDAGLVDYAYLTYSTLAHTGPISVGAATSPDRVDKAWTALNAELEKLADPDYITDEQIQAAKNSLEIANIYERERTNAFVHNLSYWWCTGGISYYITYLDNLRKVGRDDLARYVKTYMKGKNRVEAVLVGEKDVEKLEFAKTAAVINPKSGSSIVAFDKKAPKEAVTTEEFDVDGLKVVLRNNPANEIVVANMILYGGLQYYGAENAGRELLLLETLDKGSKNFSKEDVNRQLALTGASLSADARTDYSSFTLNTLSRSIDKNFAIFADAITAPLLKEEEVKLSVEQRLNAIKRNEQSPDAFISILANRNFFKGHPYEVPATGTEAAIKGMTADDLKRIQKDSFLRSRMKLFIVGDVTREKAEELVKAGFKDLPAGSYAPKPVIRTAAVPRSLMTENRELPTAYIMGCFTAPNLSSPDYAPMLVALQILDDRLFQEVRTKRNMTYAVAAQLSSRLSNYGVLYVTAVKPNDTVQVILNEVDRIVKEPVSEKELRDKVEEMITGDLMKNQANASQAGALALYDAAGPGWAEEGKALEKISAVTIQQIQAAAAKYLKDISFAALGDPEKVDRAIFTSH